MGIKAETTFSLKDLLFNPQTLDTLSARLKQADPEFRKRQFDRDVLARFPQLELKQRISWIVTTLKSYLPDHFIDARSILEQALPEPLDPEQTDDDFGEFIWVVPGEYVAKYGCQEQYLEASLSFLKEATKRFSSEGAIRPFLKHYSDHTMAFIHQCAVDENYHVRRLASEGIRPFLPWAERVLLPVDDIIAVLDLLYKDRTRYVTRSVANTLNDISKTNVDLVIHTLKRWQKLQGQKLVEFKWITRHALRTALKQDHAATLALLGYPDQPRFRMTQLQTTEKIRVGGDFFWRCRISSIDTQLLKINLRVYFLKANGQHSAKVFAVKEGQFEKGEKLEINKKVVFKPMTTRVLYPGMHYAELVVNGVVREKRAFELLA